MIAYISLDEAIQKMNDLYKNDCMDYGASIPECFDNDRAINALKELPTVPRVGKWILKKELVPLAYDTDPLYWENYDEDTHSEWKEFYHCSECDWKSGDFKGGNYCRNCGADMREGDAE